MNWEVQLKGDTHDLRELSKSLTDHEYCIIERDGKFFIETARFSSFNTPEVITSDLSNILPILTGAARLSLGGRVPIQVASIARIREDGVRQEFLDVIETTQIRASSCEELLRSDGSVEVFNPADKVPDWINLALNNTNVAKALRLFGGNEHDWVSLYRLYEVIESDMNGIDNIVNEGWATKSAIKRFKHTANSPGAIGDSARHGKESSEPPMDPMDMGEAAPLVKVILHNWLRAK